MSNELKEHEIKKELRNEIVQTLPIDVTANQVAVAEKITKKNLQTMIENAEALVAFSIQARTLAIKNTNAGDWQIFGEKIHLCESGVKKTLALIGASIGSVTIEEEIVFECLEMKKDSKQIKIEDFKVGYFTAQGEISFNGMKHFNIGTSSTKDDFFAKRAGAYIDYDSVNRNNVKKKAVTNLNYRLLNMVMKLNPTIEELKEQGVELGAGVGFGKGTNGGTTDAEEEAKLRLELRNLCQKIANDNGVKAGDLLQAFTAFNDFDGYVQVDRVSNKMLLKTITALKNQKNVDKNVAKIKGNNVK